MNQLLKNHFVKITAVICAALMTLSIFSLPSTQTITSAVDATKKALEDQIAELEKEQKILKSKIQTVKSKANETRQYKEYLDSLVNATENKMSVSERLVETLTAQIEDAEKSIAEKEVAIEDTFNIFCERMRVSYEEGQSSYLGLLLGAESLVDFLSRAEHVNSILEYDRNMMNQYKQEKEEIEALKTSLEDSKKTQEKTLADLEADKKEYESLAKESQSYLSNLEKDQKAYQAAYEEAMRAEEELDRELTAYLKKLQQQNNKTYVGGEFIWPIRTSGNYISSGYGHRSFGGGQFHKGVDIAAPGIYGAPIYASNSGTVITAAYHYSYGNYLVIDHGGGKSTLYAHCSKLLVSIGTEVKQGDVIAKVGTTGYTTGPHLHFEIRINGSHTNPMNYFK